MRVGMVTHQPFPPDIRIEKEAASLRKLGHEVLVYTVQERLAGPSEPRFTVFEYAESPGLESVLSGRLLKVLRESDLDVLHIQDTPGALSALICARRLGLPVFYDIHELWTHLVLENVASPSHSNRRWWLRLMIDEGLTCCSADRILTVVEEASLFFSQKYHLPPDRVVTIRNFESPKRFERITPDHEFAEAGKYNVTYVGGIDGPIRGLEDVVYAAKLLSTKEIRFNIIGSGSYLQTLQRLARSQDVDGLVQFIGWRDFEEAMSIVAASDLCLLPHVSCMSTENTLPHKISQYMALGKPIISSDLRPIKRLFYGAYVPWTPRTPRRLAQLVEELVEMPEKAEPFSKKGRELFTRHYQWEDEERKLLRLYENTMSS